MNKDKKAVLDFWEKASCGEVLYLKSKSKEGYHEQARIRYELEPYILDFVSFSKYKGKKVLEIGVGLGADHQKFSEAGAVLCGIDLTPRAITYTCQRFEVFGLTCSLQVADAENLPFHDESFDLVYSWGVLHHTPDVNKAIDEIFRVLKKGGEAKIMLYHKYSIAGFLLWLRYAFLKLRPLTSLEEIYSKYLESPGTKAFSVEDAYGLFKKFQTVDKIRIVLGHGDLLSFSAGQRHKGILLTVARLIWPRWFIRRFFSEHGLLMLIKAIK